MDVNFKQLKADLEKIENDNSLNLYKNFSYEQKIERCIEDNFKDNISSFRNKKPEPLKRYGYYGEILRNRKKAIKNSLPNIVSKYSNSYQNISIEYEYIAYNSTVSYSNYDILNDHDFIFEAAAFYILYNVDNYGRLDELLALLPKDEETISYAIVHPEAYDLNYSNDVICSLVALIQGFFEPNIKNDYQFILTKEYSLNNVSTLKNYDLMNKIFSLLNKDELESIVDKFKKDFYKILELVFEVCDYYQKEANDIINVQKDLIKEIESLEVNKSNIMLKDSKSFMNLQTISLVDEFAECVNQEGDLNDVKRLFRVALNLLHEDNTLLEEFEEFIVDKMLVLEVDNPFETCLAFVYLLFQKDDVIWLLNPCMTLLKLAGEKLPWNKDFNFARDNNEKEIEALKARIERLNNLTNEEYRNSNIEYFKDYQEFNKQLYKLDYDDSWRWEDPNNAEDGEIIKWNLPQLIFDYSSCVMPLNMMTFSETADAGFKQSGFKKEEIYLLKLLMSTYGTARNTYTLDNKDEVEENTNEADVSSLKESLTKKNEDLKKIRNSLNESSKNISKLKKENENLKKENDSYKDEISQLREIIFNLQSNSFDEEIVIKQKVDLPYTPNKKTIIIGGTDVWINKFKEKLEDVVFISSKTKVNQDLLKTAEVIWIQTIALKHADFYSISVYKEKRKIPLNYFSYSNIDKCLEQLIDYDMKK